MAATAVPHPRVATVAVRAAAGGVGFGKKTAGAAASGPTGKIKKKLTSLQEELRQEEASASGSPSSSAAAAAVEPSKDLTKGNWFTLANVADFGGDNKPRKLVELKGSKKLVVLHSYKGTIYAMDAYSTAYQYPLLDGKLSDGPEGQPMIETPLDGTTYDLRTGKVIKWCPPNGNPLRGLLGNLKKSAAPVPLPVFPVVIKEDGAVAVRLSK